MVWTHLPWPSTSLTLRIKSHIYRQLQTHRHMRIHIHWWVYGYCVSDSVVVTCLDVCVLSAVVIHDSLIQVCLHLTGQRSNEWVCSGAATPTKIITNQHWFYDVGRDQKLDDKWMCWKFTQNHKYSKNAKTILQIYIIYITNHQNYPKHCLHLFKSQ